MLLRPPLPRRETATERGKRVAANWFNSPSCAWTSLRTEERAPVTRASRPCWLRDAISTGGTPGSRLRHSVFACETERDGVRALPPLPRPLPRGEKQDVARLVAVSCVA